jgi:hypothetical protein
MEKILIDNASGIGVTTVGVYLILKLVFDFISKKQQAPPAHAPCNSVMADLASAIKSQTVMLQKMNESTIKTLEAINRVEQHLIIGNAKINREDLNG